MKDEFNNKTSPSDMGNSEKIPSKKMSENKKQFFDAGFEDSKAAVAKTTEQKPQVPEKRNPIKNVIHNYPLV